MRKVGNSKIVNKTKNVGWRGLILENITDPLTAGETISMHDICVINKADRKVYKIKDKDWLVKQGFYTAMEDVREGAVNRFYKLS